MFIYPVAPAARRRVLPPLIICYIDCLLVVLEVGTSGCGAMIPFEHDEAAKPEESPHDPEADDETPENKTEQGFFCCCCLFFFFIKKDPN